MQRMPISFMFNIFMYFSTNAIIFNKLQQPQPRNNNNTHMNIWYTCMYICVHLVIQLSAQMCIIHSLSLFALISAIRDAAAVTAIGRVKAQFAQRIN